ncbi:MAG: NAD(P)H-dependent oxidoreductase subunit E [Planctomycetaceae bacterium]|jgi:NADH-quinone oxidoreductase subunit F|nr:NAD(P)H-dependent oxidoreductase subunit E [Planctomycetaceae bacterium]
MISTILSHYGSRKESLIPILQAIQKEYRYLPQEVLREICRNTEITPSDIFGVATFYDQFRHEPTGEHSICVCTGTACHVKGADQILDAFHKTLGIPEKEDTDAARQFTIQKVACLGCCTLAPVVQIDGVTYGHLTPAMVPDVLDDFKSREKTAKQSVDSPNRGTEIAVVRIGLGSCCQAQGSGTVRDEIVKTIEEMNLDITVEPVGCVGMCHQTPLLEAISKRGVSTFYAHVKPEDVRSILLRNYKPNNLFRRFEHRIAKIMEGLWSDEFPDPSKQRLLELDHEPVCSFLNQQRHCAMEHCGEINPNNLADYRVHGGFAALEQVLSNRLTPEQIIEQVRISGIRGRGGAGFPTHLKWSAVAERNDKCCYVICNGDEGDPGAFMDRMLLESFPFRIIEGMVIAARAVGSEQGFFYIRAEYPLAVERVRRALEICYQNNLLGKNILGTDFTFELGVKEGAGAFVCGEETALLESMEGRRGMPRLKPPFPAQSGLFHKPTLINNVETYSLIPFIFKHGAEAFAKLGTEQSKGTKVFALAGKIRRGGLIEVPMGITIRQVVEDIGGGVTETVAGKTSNGNSAIRQRKFKAVQIGGPSGGCVPATLADTPIDFESLAKVGAIMGSGGLVVLDDNDCMVDMARYFLKFTQEQSCGKCTFCRIGTHRMLDILDRLCTGRGKPDDLSKLELLAEQVKSGSLCGLGKTAPNPVLSTLRYFRDEYEAHLQGHCPAGKCMALIKYWINENCNGCSICARSCPVGAIPATPYHRHKIDHNICTKCNACRQACPHNAIVLVNSS